MTLPWLDDANLSFPPTHTALDDPNGLLALGGDLSVARLIVAYRHGVFPWYEEGGPIFWWSPSPRAILLPDQLKISRSLKKKLRSSRYTVTCNRAFESAIEACSGSREYTSSTWITPYMKKSYTKLHELGFAHSIEVWRGEDIIGGLYGVSIGRIFFGESMFYKESDASKIALAYLCRMVDEAGFPLIDCQVDNDHLARLGATPMDRQEFEDHLSIYTAKPSPKNLWKPRQLPVWSL